VLLIPFFGFTELARVFGAGKLEQIFFRRHPLTRPAQRSIKDEGLNKNRSSRFARWDTRIRKLKLVSVSAAVVLVAAAPYSWPESASWSSGSTPSANIEDLAKDSYADHVVGDRCLPWIVPRTDRVAGVLTSPSTSELDDGNLA
jgi:hypothetical protein